MTQEDYEQLELLLGKLNTEIGDHKRFLIIPNYIHDGYCIGIYENNALNDQYIGHNIHSLVRKINAEMILKQ